MENRLIRHISDREGKISVFTKDSQESEIAFLKSNRSTHLEQELENRHPIEAIQLIQQLSVKSGVAHGLAATMALEEYLEIEPTKLARQIRQIMQLLSTIRSHLHHFYWEILPDYINSNYLLDELKPFYINTDLHSPHTDDIDILPAQEILSHLPDAHKAIDHLQKIIALFGGKFPVVMNLIPGGVTNFSIGKKDVMSSIRHMEQIREFVEFTWAEDVKTLIAQVPSSTQVLDDNLSLISFGSLITGDHKQENEFYSAGVLLDDKIQPINDFKITESLNHTYYRLITKLEGDQDMYFDLKKNDAYTWIKGARYDSETMYTGALARMLITHFGGGNIEISGIVHGMIKVLKLPQESPNCLASRLLAEVIEARFYFRDILSILMDINNEGDSNLKQRFDFSEEKAGTGKIEAPGGSLFHKVFIKNNKIEKYRILSSMNWNFSTFDEFNKTGIVERELNKALQSNNLTPAFCSKLINSYYVQVQDGTQ